MPPRPVPAELVQAGRCRDGADGSSGPPTGSRVRAARRASRAPAAAWPPWSGRQGA